MIEFINKLLVMIFCFSLLNTLRHLYYLIQFSIISRDEPIRYILSDKQLITLGVSISIVLCGIFTGITIN